MQTRSILFAIAGVAVIAGAIYLVLLLREDPKAAKVSRDRPSATGRNDVRPAIGASPTRSSNGPDYLKVDKDELPQPFQARSRPAKNHELYRGVTTDEMSHRVNNWHMKYRKRNWQAVLDEGPALLQVLPQNVQIRRVLVRAACNAGQVELGHEYMEPLSDHDKGYLEEHCRVYGSRNLK